MVDNASNQYTQMVALLCKQNAHNACNIAWIIYGGIISIVRIFTIASYYNFIIVSPRIKMTK